MKLALALAIVALVGCASTTPQTASVQRIYVIDCGESHATDLSRWTPGQNVGKPYVFGNYCYLVKHAKGSLLWDSGNPDRVAAMPNGLVNPAGTLTAFMKKPLADSLNEIGLAPSDIQHFAMSHSHGDHAGNANLFARSTIYMQQAEYDAVFGPEPQKYNFTASNFDKLRDAKIVRLNGDHDVFGDGSVVIKSAPGHTPGHQALMVRLPKTGPVLLTGDLVHLVFNWELGIVPPFNFDVPRSRRTIEEMKAYVAKTGAKVWVNHDPEQHRSIPKAPQSIE
jgi:N-acyl homoserine lactone hydrolase